MICAVRGVFKTKTRVIILTINVYSAMNQSEFEANTCNRRQARENECGQVTIAFGFVSQCLKKW